MGERPRLGLIGILVGLLILAIAAGARFAYFSSCADMGKSNGPLRAQDSPPNWSSDPGAEDELRLLSRNLDELGQFTSDAPFSTGEELTAHVSPGYPLLLSLMRKFFPSSWESWTRWLQLGLGSVTALLYFLFAWRAFESRLVAVLAGLLAALHPFWIIGAAELNDGVVASFLLGFVLVLGTVAVQTGGPLPSVLFGLGLAGLALLRAPLLPFTFAALVWFLWRCRAVERGWLCALLAFLGFANGLLPWTIRNMKIHGGPVPIVNSAYLHMWIGNNPRSTGGPQDRSTIEEALQAQGGLSLSELQTLGQRDRYQRLADPLAAYIKAYPHEFVENRLEAGAAFLLSGQWLKNRSVSEDVSGTEGTLPSWLSGSYRAILQGAILLMLFLAFLGWRWSYAWRLDSRPMILALIWIPLPYILSHAGNLHGPRLPLDGILLTLTAFALGSFWPATASHLFAGPNGSSLSEPEER